MKKKPFKPPKLPYHRLPFKITAENYFALRDLYEADAHKHNYESKSGMMRRMIDKGLAEWKPSPISYTINLLPGMGYKHSTLLVTSKVKDRILGYAYRGYSVSWLINRLIGIGINRTNGVKHELGLVRTSNRDEWKGPLPPGIRKVNPI